MATHEPTRADNSRSRVRVELGERSYDIRFYHDEPDALACDLAPYCPERALIVSNPTIWNLHGEALASALTRAGVDFIVELIGDGEEFKTLATASTLYDRLIRERFTRRACVIAFGGGVVGDLAGFVAATFMRGVTFIQVPTTLIAMVDSAVGGKTGVDHPLGKNLIGAFYQPRLVAVDLAYLRTLDDHNFRGGLAEVIKYGMIADAEFFAWLEGSIGAALAHDPAVLEHIVKRSCEIKAQVVGADERESGLRAILNYGHTFGHAIESLGQYRGLGDQPVAQFHGQAVAIGMNAAADLAVRMGLLTDQERERQRALIEAAGLPTRLPEPLRADDLIARMYGDKKVAGGKLRFVLPHAIGHVELHSDVPEAQLRQALRAIGAV
ncbi:MAG: 3-dehydroquinate synthase [Candidatus Hydrogenedentota bacterium]|nr:MAG: 3-dehydroquinate synthase [Candidatus Hydrogenedentota bacterium]